MIKKQLYVSIFAILILNACSANRDRMFGADIIEYTIPLTAKNEAKKIKRDSYNSEVYLEASEKLVQYSYAILMDKADRLMYAESFAVAKQDKEYFLELINKALSMDVNADKEMKQANLLSKLRAKWLLTRIDDLFYM